MSTLFASLKAFLAEPFSTRMSFWQYAALVGLTMVLVLLWSFVLAEIGRGMKEI